MQYEESGTSVKCMKEWRTENNVFEYWGALEGVAGDAARKVVCGYSEKFMIIVNVARNIFLHFCK